MTETPEGKEEEEIADNLVWRGGIIIKRLSYQRLVEVEMTTTIKIAEEMLPLLKQQYRTMLWEAAYKLQRERTGLLSIEQAFEKVKEKQKELAESNLRKVVEDFAKDYLNMTMVLKFRILINYPHLRKFKRK